MWSYDCCFRDEVGGEMSDVWQQDDTSLCDITSFVNLDQFIKQLLFSQLKSVRQFSWDTFEKGLTSWKMFL